MACAGQLREARRGCEQLLGGAKPQHYAAAVTQAISDLASFAEPTTLVGAIAILQRGLLRIRHQ